MKTTASGDFEKSKTWAGVKKHLEHDPKIKHKNKYLDDPWSKFLRKYNRDIKLVDFDEWTEKKFSNYVHSHDEKAMKKSKLVYGNVENFLATDSTGKRRARTLDKLYLEKFSSMKRYADLLDLASKKLPNNEEAVTRFMKCLGDSFENYVKGFNERNSNLTMFEAVVHVDEEGAPHIHSRVMPLVENSDSTKKPSWSLNKALKKQFGSKNGRENLRSFRKQEDKALIESFNKVFEKELPELGVHFELERKTPDITGMTHDAYVAKEHLKDAKTKLTQVTQELTVKQKELADTKAQVKGKKQELSEQTAKIQKDFASASKKKIKLLEREKSVKQREKDINRRDQAVRLRELKVKQKEDFIKQEREKFVEGKNELSEALEKARSLITELSEKIDAVRNLYVEAKQLSTKTKERIVKVSQDAVKTLTHAKKTHVELPSIDIGRENPTLARHMKEQQDGDQFTR